MIALSIMVEAANNVNLLILEQLKKLLHIQNISVSGNKPELEKKVTDIIAMDVWKGNLRQCHVLPAAATKWAPERFPVILESKVTVYLKARNGYT